MANLNIENLSRIVESGEIERLYGAGAAGPAQGITELRATEVGRQEGLQSVGAAAPGKSFSDVLSNSLEKVNEFANQADTATRELVAGRNKNIHETLLAVERADASFKLMVQVRNKILEAYKEIMRMQV